jgi:hypothetical protein
MMKRSVLVVATIALCSLPWNSRVAGQEPPRAVRRTIPITGMIKRAFDAGTRDSTGRPGPNYWQNSVDYTIHASLDPGTAVVTGSETVILHNNSPQPLQAIVLRLDQNIFAANVPRDGTVPEITDGMTVTKFVVDGQAVDLTTPAARGQGSLRGPAGGPPAPLAVNFNLTSALPCSTTTRGGTRIRTWAARSSTTTSATST